MHGHWTASLISSLYRFPLWHQCWVCICASGKGQCSQFAEGKSLPFFPLRVSSLCKTFPSLFDSNSKLTRLSDLVILILQPPNIEQLLFIVGGLLGGAGTRMWGGGLRTASPPLHGQVIFGSCRSYLNEPLDLLLGGWWQTSSRWCPCVVDYAAVCTHVPSLKLSPLQ